MKKSVLLLAFFIPLVMVGQISPLSSHYRYDGLIINPAYAGAHEALSITALSSRKWFGFEGAPASNSLVAHMPARQGRVGLGLLINRWSSGIINATEITGNYSYRMELKRGYLAMGIGFGIATSRISWDRLEPADAGDLLLPDAQTTSFTPRISSGIFYHNKNGFLGFSMPRLVADDPATTDGNGAKASFNTDEFIFSGGYSIGITNGVRINPSFIAFVRRGAPLCANIDMVINIKEKLWVGAGYHNRDMLAAIINYQITGQLKALYSYNFDLGAISGYLSNSHDAGISYVFRYERNLKSQRDF